MGVTATAHGPGLLAPGFTADRVVHACGDLRQAITDLAVGRAAPCATGRFRSVQRGLDQAVADAVNEFSTRRQRPSPARRRTARTSASGRWCMCCATRCSRR